MLRKGTQSILSTLPGKLLSIQIEVLIWLAVLQGDCQSACAAQIQADAGLHAMQQPVFTPTAAVIYEPLLA